MKLPFPEKNEFKLNQYLQLKEIIRDKKVEYIEARKFLNSIASNEWINILAIPDYIFLETWNLIELGYRQIILSDDWQKFKIVIE